MSDGTYTPQPFTLNGKATHAQAADYYREEYLRIVGEATTLKSVINQQAFDIEILREKVARLEAGDLNSPVRTDEYVGTYLTKGAIPQYTYNVDPRRVVAHWKDGKIIEAHELTEEQATQQLYKAGVIPAPVKYETYKAIMDAAKEEEPKVFAEMAEGTACKIKKAEVTPPVGALTQDEIAQYEGATCRH